MLVSIGLRSNVNGRVRRTGFTLLELLAAMSILAVLVAFAVPGYWMYLERARQSRAVAELGEIQIVISEFSTANDGRLPADLAELGLDGRIDPWGNAWIYVNLSLGGAPRTDQNGEPVNLDYDLYSRGADGATALSLTIAASEDDILRASDGGFVGVVDDYTRLD